MSRDRVARREAWRRIEKLSKKAGDLPLERMEEVAFPCACGGSRVYAPPAMSQAIFAEMGTPAVAAATHCGDLVYRTREGMMAVVCEACHAFSLLSEPEFFGGDDGDDLDDVGPE